MQSEDFKRFNWIICLRSPLRQSDIRRTVNYTFSNNQTRDRHRRTKIYLYKILHTYNEERVRPHCFISCAKHDKCGASGRDTSNVAATGDCSGGGADNQGVLGPRSQTVKCLFLSHTIRLR
jgi:hypothetical protein